MKLYVPFFIVIIGSGWWYEIGGWPQFYTLCLSLIRIIPLLSDAHRLDTLWFSEGLSYTSSNCICFFKHGTHGTDGPWQGLQLWQSVNPSADCVSMGQCLLSANTASLCDTTDIFPKHRQLAEQVILPSFRRVWFSAGTPGLSDTCALGNHWE